ncbi:reverse transcriptase domain-containing protein [Tanacetum coccineum]
MRAPLRARFKDLPTSDMKEILLQRMLKENYDKGHEDHKMAYEALQKSIIRDESEKFDADKAEERTKKKSKQDSSKTPPGSLETDIHKRTKNKAKNDKTKHGMEKSRRRRQPQVRQPSVESPNLEKPNNNQETFNPPIVTMDDNRTMAQLLEAPTEGYEDAIVVPEITANNFEIKHGLLNLVQNKQFFGHDKEDPHAHIRYFNKITSTMKFPNVPNTSVKLMLFPFSLEGAARIWLEKEPPRSILTWDDLVSKFINKFFPPSKTTNLRNEITRFQQKFDETFYEAWDRFNDLLRGCPHHGFSELHQLDTFYNALNSNDQDSLNSAAGGNFLDKMPRECLKIIESKSKVRQSRSKAIVSKVSTSSSTPAVSSDVAELKDMVRALILDKKNQTPAPASVKAVEQSCVTCGGGHSYQNCPATNDYRDNIQEYVSQAAAVNYNQGNASYRPQMVANQIRPPGFPPMQNHQNNQNRGINFNQNRGNNLNQNRGSNFNQGQVYQPQINQPPTFQAPPYQAPAHPTPGVSKRSILITTSKANDAAVFPIMTQLSPPKEKENEPEVTKDTVQPSTENIQPPVVQTHEPVIAVKNMFKKYLKLLKREQSHFYLDSFTIDSRCPLSLPFRRK